MRGGGENSEIPLEQMRLLTYQRQPFRLWSTVNIIIPYILYCTVNYPRKTTDILPLFLLLISNRNSVYTLSLKDDLNHVYCH